ncbi:Uncharacterized conserved protein YecE, DUF72 family [Aidingimonas halophila]|uniref:Uncharacterized conserved protein YecE, DUF72 family n=2 Tax=Aidingimonas halophila TaxID=574349 RepID=A0A1H2XGR0_9GAMM|nr:hypothetical protein GCM10008094_20650 [Aidingimonas halophila]SDW91419.1 Uncharacterized conserved protein YecE, DUF72 family [Aidingimonas halophila]
MHLGLAMWANSDWQGRLYPPHGGREGLLVDYARVFNSVEGNTTFYSGAPSEATVASWARQAPADFRFCFKLPAELTHQRRLCHVDADIDAFLARLEPLQNRLGPIMIQLPRDFGVNELPRLESLLSRWPKAFPCAVEVRHSHFFHKGNEERHLNQLLISHGIDRVMLDVRPLFSQPPDTDSVLAKAQSEKPKRPLHVISTGTRPIIRFIGHFDQARNDHYFAPWIERIKLWINQGKTPFLFVHTPDNRYAPELARHFYHQLATHLVLPELAGFAGERQTLLF